MKEISFFIGWLLGSGILALVAMYLWWIVKW